MWLHVNGVQAPMHQCASAQQTANIMGRAKRKYGKMVEAAENEAKTKFALHFSSFSLLIHPLSIILLLPFFHSSSGRHDPAARTIFFQHHGAAII